MQLGRMRGEQAMASQLGGVAEQQQQAAMPAGLTPFLWVQQSERPLKSRPQISNKKSPSYTAFCRPP